MPKYTKTSQICTLNHILYVLIIDHMKSNHKGAQFFHFNLKTHRKNVKTSLKVRKIYANQYEQ